jgi:hypothetical protein
VNIEVFLHKVIGVGVYICLFLEIQLMKWVWVKVVCEKVRVRDKGELGKFSFQFIFPPLFQGVVLAFFLKIQIVVNLKLNYHPFIRSLGNS